MRPNIGRAILGGSLGTLAITMMMYWIGPMMGVMKMDIAAILGKMLGIGWRGGMALHFINGTIIFPLTYAFLLYRVLPGGPTARYYLGRDPVAAGIRGKFCAADQPDGGKTGYFHFHSLAGHQHMEGMPGEGHGGKPGEEGYWLRHIAVGDFDMMGMHFKPGLTPPSFMATPALQC